MKKYGVCFAVMVILLFLGGCGGRVHIQPTSYTYDTYGIPGASPESIGRLRYLESRARINNAYADAIARGGQSTLDPLSEVTKAGSDSMAGTDPMKMPVPVAFANGADRPFTIDGCAFAGEVLARGDQTRYKMLTPGRITCTISFSNNTSGTVTKTVDKIILPRQENVFVLKNQ